VDHVQAVVAPVLFHREVARVAVAAVDLDRQAVRLQRPFARPALGDRGEHLQQQRGLGGGRRRAGALLVDQAGAVQRERHAAFDDRLLREQHAADVRMLDEPRRRRRGVLAAHRPALGALARVGEARLVAGGAEHGRAEADADARLVHHVEHAAQPLARRADEVADRPAALAEVQQRVGRAAVAELVVQAGELHVVARAGEPAPGIDQALGHDEQRDALDARHQPAVGARDLGQHQVHDVRRDLVLAGRDPHLVADEAVARAERVGLEAGAVRRRAGRDVAERRARLRLAQAHRAEPLAGVLARREHLLLARRAVRHQQAGVAGGQHRVAAHRDAGLGEEAVAGHLDHAGQLHAADRGVLRGGQHAARGIGLQRVVRRLRQVHPLAVEARLLGVDEAVEGRELLAREALAGIEHRVEGRARMLGEARAGAQRVDLQPVVQQEIEGVAGGHFCFIGQRPTRHA
jgi:hypothetical protein